MTNLQNVGEYGIMIQFQNTTHIYTTILRNINAVFEYDQRLNYAKPKQLLQKHLLNYAAQHLIFQQLLFSSNKLNILNL